jgi:hypothetical protein
MEATQGASATPEASYGRGSNVDNCSTPGLGYTVKQEHLEGYPNQEHFFNAISPGAMGHVTTPVSQPLASIEADSSGAVQSPAATSGSSQLAHPTPSDAVPIKTKDTPRQPTTADIAKAKIWANVLR